MWTTQAEPEKNWASQQTRVFEVAPSEDCMSQSTSMQTGTDKDNQLEVPLQPPELPTVWLQNGRPGGSWEGGAVRIREFWKDLAETYNTEFS